VSTGGGTSVVTSIGPFIDWYPQPTGGFHVEGAVGLGVITAAKGNGDNGLTFPANDQSGNAFSLLAGVGYELWVADHLSLGVLARLHYENGSVKASGDTDSTSVNTLIPAVLATLTYN
jgi:hypothetical protein